MYLTQTALFLFFTRLRHLAGTCPRLFQQQLLHLRNTSLSFSPFLIEFVNPSIPAIDLKKQPLQKQVHIIIESQQNQYEDQMPIETESCHTHLT